VSLRPAFNGELLQRAEPIFFEHEGNRAIRFGKWKLVLKYMDGWELYDLEADRTELNSLTERHPEVVKDLSARWEAWAKRTHADQWIGPRRNDWGEVPETKSQN
jgi:arylsulfatase